jgi:hypothetical protein
LWKDGPEQKKRRRKDLRTSTLEESPLTQGENRSQLNRVMEQSPHPDNPKTIGKDITDELFIDSL